MEINMSLVHINPDTGCWEWQGKKNSKGYAIVKRNKTQQLRLARLINQTPEGMDTDHLCNNTCCVNPAHLESVTPAENRKRQMLRTSHCPNGHIYTPESTTADGGHRCKICMAATRKRKYDKTYVPHPRTPKELCDYGHNDWGMEKRGRRYCKECDRIRALKKYYRNKVKN